jgi:organic radical activating enzyme
MAVSGSELAARAPLSFVWLEITGRCQLRCAHCYADSGPWRDHGTMTTDDWIRVIDQAADLGVATVQFIGGEPTLHPDLPDMISHSLGRNLAAEVYSNLVHVTPRLWQVFSLSGVRLATSYYSANAKAHERMTRTSSYGPTLANIEEARARDIPMRVGLIELSARQDVDRAKSQLSMLGVEDIRVDQMRAVGRARSRGRLPHVDELCGQCAQGKLAISPSGEIWPCVMSRWMPVGNLSTITLGEADAAARGVRLELAEAFAARNSGPTGCGPDGGHPCGPQMCTPHTNCHPLQYR